MRAVAAAFASGVLLAFTTFLVVPIPAVRPDIALTSDLILVLGTITWVAWRKPYMATIAGTAFGICWGFIICMRVLVVVLINHEPMVIEWPFLLALAALPLVGIALSTPFWVIRSRPRRRAERGICPICGYDLRGNPEGSICPECGAKRLFSGSATQT